MKNLNYGINLEMNCRKIKNMFVMRDICLKYLEKYFFYDTTDIKMIYNTRTCDIMFYDVYIKIYTLFVYIYIIYMIWLKSKL